MRGHVNRVVFSDLITPSLVTMAGFSTVGRSTERLPAGTRMRGHRVFDFESSSHQGVLIIDDAPLHMQYREGIDQHLDSILFMYEIVFRRLCQSHTIAEAASSTRGNIEPQTQVFVLFTSEQIFELFLSLLRKGDHVPEPSHP